MENTDYLNMRTTNINIRISPLLKSALIEKGAKMGVNLSDYIMHVLTKGMSKQEATCAQCAELNKKMEALKNELDQYEKLSQSFRSLLGKQVTIEDETYRISKTYDIFWLMAQSFKTRAS